MSDDLVRITIRRMGEENREICATPASTVGWLRAAIRAELGLAEGAALALCHRGGVLEDDVASLALAGLLLHPSVVAVPLPGKPKSLARGVVVEGSDGPTPPVGDDAGDLPAEEELMCRICFDGESTSSNPLIAPCRCKGSMRHVHARCLAEWRLRAVHTRSYTRCDQCRATYAVKQTWIAPLLKSRVLLHAITVLSLLLCGALGALLPFSLEERFFRIVAFRPWRWLARRRWALRALRGLLVIAAAGLTEHIRQLLSRDHRIRDACLRCLLLSLAANGPRILRVFAFIGVLHYLSYTYVTVQHHLKLAMLHYGEILHDLAPEAAR
jgi:hypothetical protein